MANGTNGDLISHMKIPSTGMRLVVAFVAEEQNTRMKAVIYSKQSRKTYSFTSNLKGTRLSDLEGSITFMDPAEASAHVDVDKHSPIIISLRPMHKSASSVPFEAGSDMCRLQEKNTDSIFVSK